MKPVSFVIRQAEPEDAVAVGELAAEFHAYLHALGDETLFDWGAAQYLRDGFGDSPAFEGIVAEGESGVVGYLLYHLGYDTDRGQRLVVVIDLYVTEASRRRGVAAALMQRTAEIGRSHGAKFILWSVYRPNEMALRFYESLGAKDIDGLRFMSLRI